MAGVLARLLLAGRLVMASTFFDRIDELSDAVGHGDLVIKVEIDQIYSHYQHEGLDLKHPRGGNAEFLRRPLITNQGAYLQKLADGLISEDGSDLIEAASSVAENLSDDAARQTPVEFDDLRESGHPSVTDDGAVVYNRPPKVGRLSEQELEEKSRLRDKSKIRAARRNRRFNG